MIQRREFIGTVAALSASFSLPKFASAKNQDRLNWRSDVIETVAHSKAARSPVVTGVSLQPGGNQLAIVGDDHYIGIYDTVERRYQRHLDRHSDWVRTTQFSPDGKHLASAGNDRMLNIWSTESWAIPEISKRHPQAIIAVAYSNDGGKIATVGFEETLRVYETTNGDLVQRLKCACPDNHAVAFSADGRQLAAGGRCGKIRVWDTTNGSQIAEFKAHKKRIRSIEFAADGKIVSAGDDQTVRLNDPANPANSRAMPRHASKLYTTALLSGDLIATGGSDNHIHVWQRSDMQEVGTLKGHTGTVSCLDFANNRLVSGSYDTHVRLWTTEHQTSAPITQGTPPSRQTSNGWNRKLK
ncbi:MAG: WD40 repeat domain-containing protein [Mariniblastus sp.]